ncbi:MAG: tRNA (adenosine(37)-N6)-threonylcarbamoyltransferase complex ATPase subunit type 1 TsaE [Magnetococcales bacterium]|nr:tRNA (adenosine(37)-N6)-threonylcarbamoyltransferase complex ATPase subunit type 1 TsaE [Magnetococcales bacterium]
MTGTAPLIWHGETGSEAATESLARKLAGSLVPGIALLLSGDLGCGKSVFARGVLRGLGVEEAYITSPTFTLVNLYDEGRMPVAHFDLYRVTDPDELDGVGIEEYVEGAGVVIVEWPEQGAGYDFGAVLAVRLEDDPQDPDRRRITLTAEEPLSRECLHVFEQQYAPGG